MKAREYRSPVLAGGVDCPTNLVFNDLFEIALIPGGCITAAKKLKSPIVFTSIQQELSIVAEDTSLVGVGVDGTLVKGLGGIMVATNIFEEAGVVAEDSGVVGVGGDGAFVEILGSIVIIAKSSEELGVVAEDAGARGVCFDGAFGQPPPVTNRHARGICFDGTFEHALGGIVVSANSHE